MGCKGVMDLRAEICTRLGLVSPFLAWGWGALEAILGSSGLQVPRAMVPGIRKEDTWWPCAIDHPGSNYTSNPQD